MKAIRYHVFGAPDVLRYEDAPRPAAGPGEALVRIAAAGVNPGDWQIRSGLAAKRFGFAFPLPIIPGYDFSGIVEAVHPDVTAFREGDAVFGMTGTGRTYAEYAAVPVTNMAHKPKSIDHDQAAGIPMSAFTAWIALFEQGGLQKGQTVLVNGAAGGVGHFAVQLAKMAGAEVIGVASGRNERFVRQLGADRFIDYTVTSADQTTVQADLVLDTVGGEDGSRLFAALKPGGTLVPVAWGQYSAEQAAEASVNLKAMVLAPFDGAKLADIAGLIDDGRLKATIHTILPLQEAAKAHELSESRRLTGKIVLRVAE
nr:NADP-dependent oxidoreductase [Paenibacillus hamazuiensis]